ncbi:MAG TPA: class I SAM-dependent methyltransferase, partial [Blastocatellia bacterium]|nr:class I SAM-dependent methyltransferase [Blastocatellia bacterium]
EDGRVVRTDFLGINSVEGLLNDPHLNDLHLEAEGSALVEHERIPFQSFPYEWPPEMLHAAGCLTLDLAQVLLKEGLGLKDATPYNILFRGPTPVFVDVLSFEKRDPTDPIWLPYAQFVRTFLLPLLANRRFHLPLTQILLTRRDGLEPEDVYRLCGPLEKLRPPFLPLVSIPTWLGRKQSQDDQSVYQKKRWDNPEKARFFLDSLFKRLRRTLNRLEPRQTRNSAWSDYMTSNNNYTSEHFEAKQAFVESALQEVRPRRVLDVGCNTGHFSRIAARSGASVVAIDYDEAVAGEVWKLAVAEGLDILPLVVDLARPSPAIGWRNRECAGFLERAQHSFDAVLMLAVIHHLLVTERIPLDEIIDIAAELTTDLLVIEFVAPGDSMFKRLLRGREHLFVELTSEVFESECRRRFEIVRSQRLPGTERTLYLMRRRSEV